MLTWLYFFWSGFGGSGQVVRYTLGGTVDRASVVGSLSRANQGTFARASVIGTIERQNA